MQHNKKFSNKKPVIGDGSLNLLENGKILTKWMSHFIKRNYKQGAFQRASPLPLAQI